MTENKEDTLRRSDRELVQNWDGRIKEKSLLSSSMILRTINNFDHILAVKRGWASLSSYGWFQCGQATGRPRLSPFVHYNRGMLRNHWWLNDIKLVTSNKQPFGLSSLLKDMSNIWINVWGGNTLGENMAWSSSWVSLCTCMLNIWIYQILSSVHIYTKYNWIIEYEIVN